MADHDRHRINVGPVDIGGGAITGHQFASETVADRDLDAIEAHERGCAQWIAPGSADPCECRGRALVAEVRRLRAENDALRRLASGRDRLLACYRMGVQRGSAGALDMISKATADLARLGADRG